MEIQLQSDVWSSAGTLWRVYQPGTGSCHAHTVPRNHISEVSSSYLEGVLAHTREASSGLILAACDRFGFSRGVRRCTG